MCVVKLWLVMSELSLKEKICPDMNLQQQEKGIIDIFNIGGIVFFFIFVSLIKLINAKKKLIISINSH